MSALPEPPQAKRVDHVREHHDDVVVDPYEWLRDKSNPEVIDYLNSGQPRDRVKVADFEYFGHSNKACWMFDYSSNVDSASKAWLHEQDLVKIHRGIFAKNAFVKSWSCHTGESMNRKWKSATGVAMIGAIGKTQYMTDELPILSSENGRWVK